MRKSGMNFGKWILVAMSTLALGGCVTAQSAKEKAYKDEVARIMYSSWEYVPDLNTIGAWKKSKRRIPRKNQAVKKEAPDPVINEGAIEPPSKSSGSAPKKYKIGQDTIKRDSIYEYRR